MLKHKIPKGERSIYVSLNQVEAIATNAQAPMILQRIKAISMTYA